MKRSPAVLARVGELAREGYSDAVIARGLGVHRVTVHRWRRHASIPTRWAQP